MRKARRLKPGARIAFADGKLPARALERTADGGWRHEEIRLEPLNPAFETWTLTPDQFEVVAEFVSVLPPEE